MTAIISIFGLITEIPIWRLSITARYLCSLSCNACSICFRSVTSQINPSSLIPPAPSKGLLSSVLATRNSPLHRYVIKMVEVFYLLKATNASDFFGIAVSVQAQRTAYRPSVQCGAFRVLCGPAFPPFVKSLQQSYLRSGRVTLDCGP